MMLAPGSRVRTCETLSDDGMNCGGFKLWMLLGLGFRVGFLV